MAPKKDLGRVISERLNKFADDLKRGRLDDYRITKLVRLPDGTIKRILRYPSK